MTLVPDMTIQNLVVISSVRVTTWGSTVPTALQVPRIRIITLDAWPCPR